MKKNIIEKSQRKNWKKGENRTTKNKYSKLCSKLHDTLDMLQLAEINDIINKTEHFFL